MPDLHVITLSRKQLYDEIWKISVSGVAKKYNLNYQRLLESCRETNIPFPASGYWTRLNCGKDVSKEVKQLPESDIENVTLFLAGIKLEKIRKEKITKSVQDIVETSSDKQDNFFRQNVAQSISNSSFLQFLDTDEREKVLAVAASLEIRENKKLHPQVIKYRDSVIAWNKQQREFEKNIYGRPRYYSNDTKEPLYIKEIDSATFPRIYKLLDALFVAVETLGGRIDPDLSMWIHGEPVSLLFREGQDKITHELTKQEAKELVEYNDRVKYYTWASKPQIRKYDYIYNGKLRIVFSDKKFFRDNEEEKVEDRLGEILIKLYEDAEDKRIVTERLKEMQRIQEEKERKEKEERQRKKLEVLKTKQLVNQAQDYKIACEIRKYIDAVEQKPDKTEDDCTWIEWAKQKADWYDPIISREDEFMGKREHEKDTEEKDRKLEFKESNYWRYRY